MTKGGSHIVVGEAGEHIAGKWLKRKDFEIVERNYRKKWGEIDIVSRKEGVVHFCEVKTVSWTCGSVSRETWRPEENVDRRKLKKFLRTVETWCLEHQYDGDWQVDVIAIRLDPEMKKGSITYIPNVILE